MDKITLYSDGSARGNPGPGGYGTILKFTDAGGTLHEKEFTAGYRLTTNNRMELLGVITGLEALKRPCEVLVVSDSKYVVDAFEQNWVDSWLKNNFRTAAKKPVKNQDLWMRLIAAKEKHNVSFQWVKGHAGHPQNERCDKLATSAADGDGLLDDNYNSDV